ncbi:DUF2931 family protein [Flavobacterium sp. MR2016-29]|uniref:DUF2931 family protein n=1 Tax=Flavobacterium sp. MR2016-29 TaxID=2783795 RepID=UPI00188D95F1|nr:DUF2931 family protein [Flavobacterium sp. MR2016-29]MBF4491706.1 DUF2931 family protein [Flavobacterium sp. MR2016-29]
MIKKISILLFFGIMLSSCMEKKYEWSADISAPREYPIEVYTGAVGDYFFSQMGGFTNAGWGNAGSVDFIEAPLPDSFDMTWLSYVDNKFYTGEWKLPTEKIEELFDLGFYSTVGGKEVIEPYKYINIGFAPKGMVIVWVAGNGKQVEVGRFQAHETVIDPRLISEDEKYMFRKDYAKDNLNNDFVISKDLREQIKQYGFPPPEVYEQYREKYSWKPKIILPEGCKITSLYIKMCNGEIEDSFNRPMELKKRAVPYQFEIYWSIGSGKQEQQFVSRITFTKDTQYWAKYLQDGGGDNEMPVDFDKNEIRRLFKEHIDKNKPAEIVIKIDPNVELKSERVTKLYVEQSENQYLIKEKVTRTGKYN